MWRLSIAIGLLVLMCISCAIQQRGNGEEYIEAEGMFCLDDEKMGVLTGKNATSMIEKCDTAIPDALLTFTMSDGSELGFQSDQNGAFSISGVRAEDVVSVLFDSKNTGGFSIDGPVGEDGPFRAGKNTLYIELPVMYCESPDNAKQAAGS